MLCKRVTPIPPPRPPATPHPLPISHHTPSDKQTIGPLSSEQYPACTGHEAAVLNIL